MLIDKELAQARADHRTARLAFGEAVRDQVAAEDGGDSSALRDAGMRAAAALRAIASASARVRELTALSRATYVDLDAQIAHLLRVREELVEKRGADDEWWLQRVIAMTPEPVRRAASDAACAAFTAANRRWIARARKARRTDVPELDEALEAALTWVRHLSPAGVAWSLEDGRLVATRADGSRASYPLAEAATEVPPLGGAVLFAGARAAIKAEHMHEHESTQSERSA